MNRKYSIEEIERLVELFMDGGTSLDEERRLYDFFTHEDVPASLAGYKEMFADFAAVACSEGGVKADSSAAAPCIRGEKPMRRMVRLGRWAVAVAASVAVVWGVSFLHDRYESKRLADLYGGSYMVVDGVRIDNLKKIRPDIERVLAHAEEIESKFTADESIRMAEQNVLNGIPDEAERERIRRLLDE